MAACVELLYNPQKYIPPEEWPFERARQLFKQPQVTDPSDIEVVLIKIDTYEVLTIKTSQLKWTDPKEEALVEYMFRDKGFKLVHLDVLEIITF